MVSAGHTDGGKAGYHEQHMNLLMPSLRKVFSDLKKALDPNEVISPGKYGINIKE